MFTGFASENTPAIQVWDFFRAFASTTAVRSVSLPDDCAPIQVFRTGATNTAIRVYLPTAPIEGKQITIANQRFGLNSQVLEVYSSDVNGAGTNAIIASVGSAQSLVLVYSKQAISFGTSNGFFASGWLTLNQSPVASPDAYSVISGGDQNKILSTNSFIGGGLNNQVSNAYSAVVGGNNNITLSAFAAVIGGQGNTASGSQSAVVGGATSSASGISAAVVGGSSNNADSTNSVIAGGANGTARSIIGNFVTPASNNPITPLTGRTQTTTLLLGRQTTDATATVLTSNSFAASTTNQVILPNNSAYTFQGTCIANVIGGSTTSGWAFQGVIKRGANAASTTLVAAVTPTVIAQDAGAAAWVLAITADTTNGGIAVTVTGAAATTIRWVAKN